MYLLRDNMNKNVLFLSLLLEKEERFSFMRSQTQQHLISFLWSSWIENTRSEPHPGEESLFRVNGKHGKHEYIGEEKKNEWSHLLDLTSPFMLQELTSLLRQKPCDNQMVSRVTRRKCYITDWTDMYRCGVKVTDRTLMISPRRSQCTLSGHVAVTQSVGGHMSEVAQFRNPKVF